MPTVRSSTGGLAHARRPGREAGDDPEPGNRDDRRGHRPAPHRRSASASPTAEVAITVQPGGTVADPLVLEFRIDASILAPTGLGVGRPSRSSSNGAGRIPACADPGASATPDPCVAVREPLPLPSGGGARLVIRTSAASRWNFGGPALSLRLILRRARARAGRRSRRRRRATAGDPPNAAGLTTPEPTAM